MTTAPTSRWTGFLLCLAIIGCSDSLTSPRGQSTPPDVGDLAVSINVTGDPSLGPSAFRIWVDGNVWGIAQPNETQKQQVRAGAHEIVVGPLEDDEVCILGACGYGFSSILNSWCALASADHQSVTVTPGQIQSVTFALDCPLLVGEGAITVETVATTGTAIPAEFTILITRMRRPFSRKVTVPANGSATFSVPVGIYEVAVIPGPTCEQTISDIVTSSSHAIIRDGGDVRTWQIITCD